MDFIQVVQQLDAPGMKFVMATQLTVRTFIAKVNAKALDVAGNKDAKELQLPVVALETKAVAKIRDVPGKTLIQVLKNTGNALEVHPNALLGHLANMTVNTTDVPGMVIAWEIRCPAEA